MGHRAGPGLRVCVIEAISRRQVTISLPSEIALAASWVGEMAPPVDWRYEAADAKPLSRAKLALACMRSGWIGDKEEEADA